MVPAPGVSRYAGVRELVPSRLVSTVEPPPPHPALSPDGERVLDRWIADHGTRPRAFRSSDNSSLGDG